MTHVIQQSQDLQHAFEGLSALHELLAVELKKMSDIVQQC